MFGALKSKARFSDSSIPTKNKKNLPITQHPPLKGKLKKEKEKEKN